MKGSPRGKNVNSKSSRSQLEGTEGSVGGLVAPNRRNPRQTVGDRDIRRPAAALIPTVYQLPRPFWPQFMQIGFRSRKTERERGPLYSVRGFVLVEANREDKCVARPEKDLLHRVPPYPKRGRYRFDGQAVPEKRARKIARLLPRAKISARNDSVLTMEDIVVNEERSTTMRERERETGGHSGGNRAPFSRAAPRHRRPQTERKKGKRQIVRTR